MPKNRFVQRMLQLRVRLRKRRVLKRHEIIEMLASPFVQSVFVRLFVFSRPEEMRCFFGSFYKTSQHDPTSNRIVIVLTYMQTRRLPKVP